MHVESDMVCVFTTPFNKEYWEKIHTPLFTYSDSSTFERYLNAIFDRQRELMRRGYTKKLTIVYDLYEHPRIEIPQDLHIKVVDHMKTPVRMITLPKALNKFIKRNILQKPNPEPTFNYDIDAYFNSL